MEQREEAKRAAHLKKLENRWLEMKDQLETLTKGAHSLYLQTRENCGNTIYPWQGSRRS